jgi:hypothetical protein
VKEEIKNEDTLRSQTSPESSMMTKRTQLAPNKSTKAERGRVKTPSLPMVARKYQDARYNGTPDSQSISDSQTRRFPKKTKKKKTMDYAPVKGELKKGNESNIVAGRQNPVKRCTNWGI